MEIHEPTLVRARSARVRATFARRRVFFHGTHWLQISPYRWTIQLKDGFMATSSSPMKRQDAACHRLAGEKLEAILIDRLSGRTVFYFDLGSLVTVRGSRVSGFSEFDIWTLHARKRGRFVAIHAGGDYRSGSLRGTGDGTHPISPSVSKRFLLVGSCHRGVVMARRVRPIGSSQLAIRA